MPASESPSKLARAVEEGRIMNVSPREKELMSSPTLSTGTTFVGTTNFPSEALSAVRNLPSRLRGKFSHKSIQRKRKSRIVIRKLEDSPRGFPYVASYLDSEDTFAVFRRFGWVHTRLLLNKQDELRVLESDLRAMDKLDGDNASSRKYLQSRTKDNARQLPPGRISRQQLLDTLEKKTLEYGQLLLQAQQLLSLNRPADRDHQSVINFLENDFPLFEKETSFVYEKEDLVTLRPGRETAFLDAFVERMLKVCHCRPIQRIFRSEETRAKTDDPDIHYYTKERINAFVTMIITCFILVVLVVPIWALYHLTTTTTNSSATSPICIGILLISTLVFSAVLSLFTKARRHEILAAAAGYCAVLVVFVSNVSSFGGNIGSSTGL